MSDSGQKREKRFYPLKRILLYSFLFNTLFGFFSPIWANEAGQSTIQEPSENNIQAGDDKTVLPKTRSLMILKDYIAVASGYLKNGKNGLAVVQLHYAVELMDKVEIELVEADPVRFLKLKKKLLETRLQLNTKNLKKLASAIGEFILLLQGKIEQAPPSWGSTFMMYWIKIQNYIFIILSLFVAWFLYSLGGILKKRAWKRIGILLLAVFIPALFEGIGRLGILTGLPLLNNLSFMTNEYARLIFVLIIGFAIFYSRLGFQDINQAEEQLENLNKSLKVKVEEQTKELSFLLDATIKTSQTQDMKEIIKLFSEMLIRSFSCHTFSRVAIMNKPEKTFQFKHISSIRPMNFNSMIDQEFSLDNFPFLRKALSCQDIKMISADSGILDDNEKKFIFQDQFKTALILPFIHDQTLLGFGMVCEARSPTRSHFSKTDIEFYKTLANHLGVSIHNAQLFSRNKTIFLHTIQALAAAVDARDTYTLYHSKNVTEYAVKIAEEMDLAEGQIIVLKTAGLLHDIGKIGIKDEILLKTGKLTEEEYKEFTTHSVKAVKILEAVEELEDVITIIAAHHERYDGKGYPHGLEGEKIPLEAKIIAVADTYDALTTSRNYRKPVKHKEAVEEIKQFSGTQFDPEVVEAFLNVASALPSGEEPLLEE